ncbi:MAG TPA: hypothetical protein VFZ61_15240 [Polyangiales bacterium]
MTTHIACLGHGSLEATDEFGRETRAELPLPSNVRLVLYTPFGAAMEGGLCDDIYESFCAMSDQQSTNFEGYLALLRQKIALRPRQTKGFSAWQHEAIAIPSAFPMVVAKFPDLTLTGSGSMRYSGVYSATERKQLVALASRQEMRLSLIIEKIGNAPCVVHWLACQSDRGDFAGTLGSDGRGLKAGIGQ